MKFYKITFYVIIVIVLIFLLYTLYNYIKPKAIAIEPFYDIENNDPGPPESTKFSYESRIFFDIIETYGYLDMPYLWYSMPYYNEKVTIDDNENLVIPASYFLNNNTVNNNIAYNANGIFARYVNKYKYTANINQINAAVILARPNIHRINLKNFILTNGNTPENFNLSDTDIATLKNTYNVLYKINFWHSALKSGFYDNIIIGEKLDSKVTGFDYVKYIYNPSKYIVAISSKYYSNYVSSYIEFVNDKLGYDYYSLNNNMALINDIYNGDISILNLAYVNEMYPYEKLRPEGITQPYREYLKKVNDTSNYDFKRNVNAASRIIMQNYIATTPAKTPGVSEPELDYNKIFKGSKFESSVNPGTSNNMNEIKSHLTDFFNNFYILNALYALYAERYYYVDSKYYNSKDSFYNTLVEKNTLSFKDGKFIGGETFTTTYNDWLTTIGIDTNNANINASAYINTNGTKFIGTGEDFSLYYYITNPYLNDKVITKSYEVEWYLSKYKDPIFPISKLYRGQTYVDAINILDNNKTKDRLTLDRKDIESKKGSSETGKEACLKRIKNIIRNKQIREAISVLPYEKFTRPIIDKNYTYTFYLKPVSTGIANENTNAATVKLKDEMIVYRLTGTLTVEDNHNRGFGIINTVKNKFYLENIAKGKKHQPKKRESTQLASGRRSKNYTVNDGPAYIRCLYRWLDFTKDDRTNYREAQECVQKKLEVAATKLLNAKIGIGIDAMWYYNVCINGLNDGVAESVGDTFTESKNATYSSNIASLKSKAKTYVASFNKDYNGKENTDARAYWKYPLTGENSLETLLEKEKNNYNNNYNDTSFNDSVDNLTIEKYYKSAVEKYNKLYSDFIPKLLRTTIEKLNNSITKIDLFNDFMTNFTDLTIHNYKWDEITRTKSINKILDVNYGKSINQNNNKIYPDFTKIIFKNINRNTVESSIKNDEDKYNAVLIKNLIPALVYFEDYTGTLNTPSSSNDVYNDTEDDFLIYLKNKDKNEILKAFQVVVNSDLILLKEEINSLLVTIFNELEKAIQNDDTDAVKKMKQIDASAKTLRKAFLSINSPNIGPKMLTALTAFENTLKQTRWEWIESLYDVSIEFAKKTEIVENYYRMGLFELELETLDRNLELPDEFNPGNPIKNRINKQYEYYYFSKPNFFYKKTADMYSYIYCHPKILMTYSNSNSDINKKSGFSIFDLGIILRYIFDYDIRTYVDGTEKYTNYDFPTLFQYDSNNLISIKSDTTVLSDENYKNLSINSKLNNFFDIIEEQYNAFNKDFPDVIVPIDYFNFSQSETLLRKELDDILVKLTKNKNYPIDIIKYSYTTYFISSVNCLCTMYTDDVCNIILPLYKHLNYTFTVLIEKVYDFDLPEFKNIKSNIINGTFLNSQGEKFKTFYERYRTQLKLLNNGIVTQSSSPSESKSSPSEDYTNSDKSGTLIYLFNVHNFLLNLILRAFYYYNKYAEYKNNTIYDEFISNKFGTTFKQTVEGKDSNNKFVLEDLYLVNNCNIFTNEAYMESLVPFITNAITLYTTKIIKCCYNHILVNMANIVYQLNSKSIYIYNSGDEYSQIEKGERLIKTMKLYENMLTTVKNGETYIKNVSSTLKIQLSGVNESNELYEAFENLKDMFNKYLNTVFYIGNAKLYGCFGGNISKYYSSLGFSEFIDKEGNRKQGKESTLISYVNNKDTNGNDTKYGAIINCVNDTLAHNELINTDTTPGTTTKNKSKLYDLVSIVPYSIAGSSKGATIDTYSCYAGKSSKFKAPNDVEKTTIPLTEMDKCSVKYLDPDGNKNKDFDQNITSNTVIYQIDVSNKNDSDEVSFLGCFKKSIPDMGIYNTLPNFIGNISGKAYTNPSDLMEIIKDLVTDYNDSFGTNYDIYGITTNLEDTLQLDVYAGESSVDAKYAQYAKNDGYQENCNIFYPGPDNYMIYQDKEKIVDPCLTNEVNHVKNYTDLLTEYLNKNIKTQQETISEMGVDINLLKNLFPIKFSISKISNSKDNASLSVDESKSIGFDPNNDSIRTCALSLVVKEGPQGIKGDVGALGEKGKNVKGPRGDIGNAGYWGESKN
jgi:hypothetical protein